MPKPIVTVQTTPVALETVFDDLRVLLEARRADYQMAADRISDILASLNPKPRMGRPPKAK